MQFRKEKSRPVNVTGAAVHTPRGGAQECMGRLGHLPHKNDLVAVQQKAREECVADLDI